MNLCENKDNFERKAEIVVVINLVLCESVILALVLIVLPLSLLERAVGKRPKWPVRGPIRANGRPLPQRAKELSPNGTGLFELKINLYQFRVTYLLMYLPNTALF